MSKESIFKVNQIWLSVSKLLIQICKIDWQDERPIYGKVLIPHMAYDLCPIIQYYNTFPGDENNEKMGCSDPLGGKSTDLDELLFEENQMQRYPVSEITSLKNTFIKEVQLHEERYKLTSELLKTLNQFENVLEKYNKIKIL